MDARHTIALMLALCAVGGALAQIQSRENKTEDLRRKGKVFSLFNVVRFQNSGCKSSSTFTGAAGSTTRNGTCYTRSDCASKGGSVSGNCAAGFGVCCVFLYNTATSLSINQNCSYIQNPGFPAAYTGQSSITYTINKVSSAVCDLRLDFESFTLRGIGLTTEVATAVCQDTFIVTAPSNQPVPTICGMNAGQHLYLDMGANGGDTVSLAFTFAGASTTRTWDIKVTQIPCGSSVAVHDDCLQYFTGLTGRFTTFNFIPTNDNHLPNQQYSACIRQEEGFCCVQFQVCADLVATATPVQANPGFSLDTSVATAMQDSICTNDYIGIPGSSATCNQGTTNLQVDSKYCGRIFSNQQAATAAMGNAPVCDCTPPFRINVFTNQLPDIAAGDTSPSRGVCLEYMQIPCQG